MTLINDLNKTPFICSVCKRVCTNIEADGICGSPKCRKKIE